MTTDPMQQGVPNAVRHHTRAEAIESAFQELEAALQANTELRAAPLSPSPRERRHGTDWPGGSRAAFKARVRREVSELASTLAGLQYGSAFYPEALLKAVQHAHDAVTVVRREVGRWR